MLKLLKFAFVAFALLTGSAQAQMGSFFPGPGTVHSVGGSACSPTVCPGDVAGWSGAYAFYSFRCYTFAYSGNVILIQNVGTPATQSLLTCSGGVVSVTGTALATTCASPCEINTWYNQSGGSGPDLTQASGAPRARVTLASFVGEPSAYFDFNTLTGNIMSAAAPAALPQPLTVAIALNWAVFQTSAAVLSNNGFAFVSIGTIGGGNHFVQSGGSRDDFSSGAEPVLESNVVVHDGASTTMKINGAAPTTGSNNPGTNGIANTGNLAIGSTDSGAAFFSGNVYEVLIISGAKSSGDQTLIVANQRAIGTGW